MKNNITVRLLALALLCCICICSFGCANAEEKTEYIWEDKWNSMVVEGTEDVKLVMLHYNTLVSGFLIDYAPAFYTEQTDIDNIIGVLKELQFKEVQLEEQGRPFFNDGSISITIISDTREAVNETGDSCTDETGTAYTMAVRCHVRKDGYVYIECNPNAPNSLDDSAIYFKSTTKISYDEMYNLRKDDARIITLEEYEEIFGYYPKYHE
ncbi:MAG: hypothetical protein IJX51_03160 [Clostridia bacterium]|nr:hypothetical protein [Clostridia bacterium]